MGWRTTFDDDDWTLTSKRGSTNVDRYPTFISVNGNLYMTGFGTVTKAAITTVEENGSYTQAVAEAAALAIGNAMTKNAQGDITYQRTVDVIRQNEADAYKVVRTIMNVTITT